MAHRPLYTYLLMDQENNIGPPPLEVFREVLKTSLNIRINVLVIQDDEDSSKTLEALFVYDEEDDSINLEYYVPWIETPRVSVKDFHYCLRLAIDPEIGPLETSAFPFPAFCISNTILTTYNFWEPIRLLKTEKVEDWSQTISDLWTEGFVETKESSSGMAVDKRKFWFRTEGPESAVDVDCLGTSLCSDISERVSALWESIQNKKDDLTKDDILEDFHTLLMIDKKSREMETAILILLEKRGGKPGPLKILGYIKSILENVQGGIDEFLEKYPEVKDKV